jgi:DNA-binding Lrp family transcriptional regulator
VPRKRLVVAQILVVVEIGREHEIADQIRNLPGITEIAVTYGQYDIVAKLTAETMADLDRVVTLIRKIPGVLRTSTLVWSI